MTTKEISSDSPTTKTINAEFGGKIPTFKEIFAKFPPNIEMFKDTKDGSIFFRKISRSKNGIPLYFVPPSDEDFARENLIFHLKKRLPQTKREA